VAVHETVFAGSLESRLDSDRFVTGTNYRRTAPRQVETVYVPARETTGQIGDDRQRSSRRWPVADGQVPFELLSREVPMTDTEAGVTVRVSDAGIVLSVFDLP
jgi:hypothetical protein